MKDSKETTKRHNLERRRQRAIDLNGLLGANKHLFSFKDVCEKADLNYDSTSNAINRLIKKNDVYAISDEKLDLLEETTIDLSEEKMQPKTV